MTIKAQFVNTNEFAFELETTSTKLVNKLVDKMTYLMQRLQLKAQANASDLGSIPGSIRNPRAEYDGTYIVGKLNWGGYDDAYNGGKPYDRAQILEYGADPHVINPLGQAGTRTEYLHDKRKTKRRIGGDLLYFYWDKVGKNVAFAYVFHPGVKARRFMGNALDDMIDTFRREIKKSLREVTASKGRI